MFQPPDEPADLAATIERGTAARGSRGGFAVYAVLDVPFRSGHVLSLERCPFPGPGQSHTSVWHRSPDGAWTVYAEAALSTECVRAAARTPDATVVAPIRLEWTGPRNLVVMVDGGRLVAWSIALAPTLVTRGFNALAWALGRPQAIWMVGVSRATMGGRDVGPNRPLHLARFACAAPPPSDR